MKRGACEFRSATVCRSLDDNDVDGAGEGGRVDVLVVLVGGADGRDRAAEVVHGTQTVAGDDGGDVGGGAGGCISSASALPQLLTAPTAHPSSRVM